MKLLSAWSVRHARPLFRLYAACARLAPRLAPVARLLGVSRTERWLVPVERSLKRTFFDCRMCGDCALSATGLACPMTCAKQMRSGPCGGVRANGHCEVRPEQPCTWVRATEGDARIAPGHLPTWRQALPPIDARRAGRSSWIRLIAPQAESGPPPLGHSCDIGWRRIRCRCVLAVAVRTPSGQLQ